MSKTDQKVFIALALIIGFLLGFIAGKASFSNDVQKIIEKTSSVMPSGEKSDDASEVVKSKISLLKAKYDGVEMFNGSETEAPFLGNADAKVTIKEYSDFQCPYCASFFNKTLPSIVDNYIKTGDVKVVFRDFPLSGHANAVPSAIATHCAGAQDNYWYMHDLIFDTQSDWSRLERTEAEAIFLSYAKELGLDTNKFSACQVSDTYNDLIQGGFQEGVAAGVDGTPGFDIEGELLVGAQPYAKFDQILKTKLGTK